MNGQGPAEQPTSHGDSVPGAQDYARERSSWRTGLGADEALRREAVELQVAAEVHRYTYQWEWAGVPIIRLPDDVMLAQELFWDYRPERVIETGVARGGSVLLAASLMRLTGAKPAVLGIDHKLFPHTTTALRSHSLSEGVELFEGDSTSVASAQRAASFLAGASRAVLILDSNHTHDHVLAELRRLAPLLPVGGIVMVADTLIEEFPKGHFAGRPWDRGNNPLTALRAFLSEADGFEYASEWCRRGLLSEFRDGVIRRKR